MHRSLRELTYITGVSAIEVLQYRIKQREEKAQRELEIQQKNREHQARMQTQYGIDLPSTSVAIPPHKKNISTSEWCLDTTENWLGESKKALSKLNLELKEKLKRYLAILRSDDLSRLRLI